MERSSFIEEHIRTVPGLPDAICLDHAAMNYGDGTTVTCTYDATGNQTSMVTTCPQAHQIGSVALMASAFIGLPRCSGGRSFWQARLGDDAIAPVPSSFGGLNRVSTQEH